jgi:two-component system, NarL family, nitrate/nitrite response regulator NarL
MGEDSEAARDQGVVVLHTKVELVRHGLMAMLQATGQRVRMSRCRQDLRAVVASCENATVILGLDDGDVAETGELSAECRARGAGVLVLVPGVAENALDDVMSIPFDGYLLQEELTVADLAAAVDCVSNGRVYLPPTLASRLLANARSGAGARVTYGQLTPRESEVVALLVDGMSNKQIAKALRISQHGVKRLVANVLAKLNCSNRTSAVSVALRENLVQRAAPGAAPALHAVPRQVDGRRADVPPGVAAAGVPAVAGRYS